MFQPKPRNYDHNETSGSICGKDEDCSLPCRGACVKHKAIPVTGCGGSAPHFLDNWLRDGGEVASGSLVHSYECFG
jgi:hypothetical protein